MTHQQITSKAAKWLKKHDRNILVPNCSIVETEIKSVHKEIPDIIGWCSWASVLIEVKTSRADFFKDFKKPFRANEHEGIGDFRYYICPTGLIKEEELPALWGLLYIDEKGKIEIIKKAEKQSANHYNERNILTSIIRNKKQI